MEEKEFNEELYSIAEYNKLKINKLLALGVLSTPGDNTRDSNVGTSDYSVHLLQPWSMWLEYGLNPWDADILKRVLRTKEGDSRKLDYEKIIHICKERIRQINEGYE